MVATGGASGLLVLAGLVAGLWLRGVAERAEIQAPRIVPLTGSHSARA
jgi:hypothetical protein